MLAAGTPSLASEQHERLAGVDQLVAAAVAECDREARARLSRRGRLDAPDRLADALRQMIDASDHAHAHRGLGGEAAPLERVELVADDVEERRQLRVGASQVLVRERPHGDLVDPERARTSRAARRSCRPRAGDPHRPPASLRRAPSGGCRRESRRDAEAPPPRARGGAGGACRAHRRAARTTARRAGPGRRCRRSVQDARPDPRSPRSCPESTRKPGISAGWRSRRNVHSPVPGRSQRERAGFL